MKNNSLISLYKFFLFSVVAVQIVACAKQDDARRADRVAKESQTSAQKNIEAENENLRVRAQAMEDDLTRRQRFFKSLAGIFEGTYKTSQGEFATRITFISTVKPFSLDRLRSPEEITEDLKNLSFSVQVIHWNPNNPVSASGCNITGAHPDLMLGTLALTSAECPSLYIANILPSAPTAEQGFSDLSELKQVSQSLAVKILNAEVTTVDYLQVRMQSLNRVSPFVLNLKRVEK